MTDKVEIVPAVLLNISDHYTREKVEKNNPKIRVLGGLLGQVDGRKLKILQTIEFKYEINQSNLQIQSIDFNFIKSRVDLFKQDLKENLFKDYEFLGWYSAGVGQNPYPNDMKFQNQISENVSSNPIYLIMDTVTSMKGQTDLPVKLFEVKYEQVIASDQHKKHTQESFIELNYDILASKADTITIESASKSYSSSAKSVFAENLKNTVNAVKRFSERIEGIIKLLDTPAVTQNPSLLLELNQILSSFPQQYHETLDEKMLEHFSDANIISFLSALAAANRIISNVSEHKSAFKQSKMNML
ncbi:JAB1/Mov34/MPN/PAD-1 ubiquitin protease (macronuclear) [Tetrahymena thermophila SB210]|uniref:COP9 signalosome complex subunit 6 n=1 Tax=Tetrahymena thermophila (strain SB210) TaxID=312017 RepID=I7M1G3_TETTS|nr:JAB1/Mov34/MPN/PAD-1 ubiquitin protease [Tetrahymena thermophila SB210]EAR96294.1 JAB1/Mov34/MPN/PAD-1 ubiquitin protease [Tetrahymena thermophila SB210]|eukprot:XP_001016539.1 JAB1/Mov34/MPN/PAD-1 ubiquitin protease [Tetrahymena thermophila SB210]